MDVYQAIRVIQSTVKTTHKAIIAHASDGLIADHNKTKTVVQYSKHTPVQAASFLEALQRDNWNNFLTIREVQTAADEFYLRATSHLNDHFPLASVTMSSRDPPFVTPAIKSMLRQRNQLMRAGRVDKAGAIGERVGQLITQANSKWLAKTEPGSTGGAKEMWHKVNSLTGRSARPNAEPPDAVTMNTHYAAISTDPSYARPLPKHSCAELDAWPSEYAVFNCLDRLKPTATGPDGLPSWFLKLAAPAYARPIAHLYSLSLDNSNVPSQWKEACITPCPKSQSQ